LEDFVIELSAAEEEIRKVIEPLLDSEGYELVRLSYKKSQSKGHLMLFVDTCDRENGIKMENLTDVSRLLSDVLDASFENSKILHGRYDLQVSSPGLDRPLTKKSHFEQVLGKKMKIRIKNSGAGSKRVQGQLLKLTDDGFELRPESGPDLTDLTVRFADVVEAHVIFEFQQALQSRKKAE